MKEKRKIEKKIIERKKECGRERKRVREKEREEKDRKEK